MQTLASLARHTITYVVGMLVAWLAVYLTGTDLKAATDAANALVEPLVILSGFVAVILARLAMPFLNNLFRRAAGENADPGLRLVPWLVGIGLGTAVVGTLPSCSPSSEYPLTGSVSYRDISTGSKAGLSFSPGHTPQGNFSMPVRDAATGEVIGSVNLHSGK